MVVGKVVGAIDSSVCLTHASSAGSTIAVWPPTVRVLNPGGMTTV
jgi:hypothetical protein